VSETANNGMGFTGVVAIVVLIGYFAIEVYGFHHAREQMEPAQVYLEFAGARRAATVCDADSPDRADVERNFDRNFGAVTRLVTEDLAQSQPSLTPAELDLAIGERRQSRESEVDALIAQQGCAGKEVWRLRKLYEVRSRLKLRY